VPFPVLEELETVEESSGQEDDDEDSYRREGWGVMVEETISCRV
jgi:hypothetical protein